MNKKVTMQDIATKLNISRVTVSKAFKGSNDISAETRDNILRVAKEMRYKYKSQLQKNVLVLVNSVFLELDEQFYTTIYKKMIHESDTKGVTLNLNVITRTMEDGLILPTLNFADYDGLIILGELSIPYIHELVTLKLPIVFIDFYHNVFEVDSIITNNYLYSYEMTSYLIQNGHKDIGFVGNFKSTSSLQDRYLGYYKALLENDLPLNPDYIVKDRDDSGLIKEFDLASTQPTAYVCNNDNTALNLIEYLKSINIHVPDDVSVVGFDDISSLDLLNHHLTSVRISLDEMVDIGIRRILRRIANDTSKAKTYVVNADIVLRSSVKTLSD